ncbi:PAS domain S-box protein [Candidatus Auribacterota bacterium]
MKDKQSNEPLRKKLKLYEEMLQTFPISICRFLPKTNIITFVNDTYCKYFNMNKEDLIGYSFFELIPKEEHKKIKKHFNSLSKKKPLMISENIVHTPKGPRWQKWKNQALFDKSGKIIEYQSIGEDITEQKLAEEALRESEEKFRTFMETASDLMFIANKDTLFTYANKTMAETLGYSKGELLGMPITKLFVEKNQTDVKQKIKDAIEKEKISFEESWLTKNGKVIHGELKIVGIFDSAGKLSGGRGIFRDMTAYKKTQQILLEQKKNLEQKNIALKELLEHIELEKKNKENNTKINIEKILFPLLEKLKTKNVLHSYVDLLDSTMNELNSAFGLKIADKMLKLSDREIEVCNMIKNGLTGKEIAKLLNISFPTVETHRKNIRHKLDIKNKDINLTTYLKRL